MLVLCESPLLCVLLFFTYYSPAKLSLFMSLMSTFVSVNEMFTSVIIYANIAKCCHCYFVFFIKLMHTVFIVYGFKQTNVYCYCCLYF